MIMELYMKLQHSNWRIYFRVIKMYWLLGWMSTFCISNKILTCREILKSIRTYGIQLWGTASTSNAEILERFQSIEFCA
jgi:hypothetical protein